MFDHGTVCFRAGRTSGEIIAAGAVQTQDGERCLPLPRYSASTCASNLCGNARSIAYFLYSVFLPKQDAAFRAVEREDIFNAHNLRPFGHQISPAIRPIGGERDIHAPRPMENCLMEWLSTGDVCAACNTRFPSLAWIRQFPTCFHAQDERLPLQGRQKGREEPGPAIPIAPKAPFPTFLPIPAFPRYCLRSSA